MVNHNQKVRLLLVAQLKELPLAKQLAQEVQLPRQLPVVQVKRVLPKRVQPQAALQALAIHQLVQVLQKARVAVLQADQVHHNPAGLQADQVLHNPAAVPRQEQVQGALTRTPLPAHQGKLITPNIQGKPRLLQE